MKRSLRLLWTVLLKLILRVVVLALIAAMLLGMAWLVRGRTEFSFDFEHGLVLTPIPMAHSHIPPVPVRLFCVQSRRNSDFRELTGVIESRYVSELAFRVPGEIALRRVEIGQQVRAGDELMRLDTVDLKLELDAAVSELNVANANFRRAESHTRRMKEMHASKSINEDELEIAQTQWQVAKNLVAGAERRMELARNRLSYCTLTAATDGTVVEIFAESGQFASAGQRILKIAHGAKEAVVNIPERWINQLQLSPATLKLWNQPDAPLPVHLRQQSPTADPDARTFETRYSMESAPPELKLGTTVTLEFLEKSLHPGYWLPATALAGDSSAPFVWKLSGSDGVVACAVNVLSYGPTEVQVSGDLDVGDTIVSAGVHKLDANSKVRGWEELK